MRNRNRTRNRQSMKTKIDSLKKINKNDKYLAKMTKIQITSIHSETLNHRTVMREYK
jgi:hypothetical protein